MSLTHLDKLKIEFRKFITDFEREKLMKTIALVVFLILPSK